MSVFFLRESVDTLNKIFPFAMSNCLITFICRMNLMVLAGPAYIRLEFILLVNICSRYGVCRIAERHITSRTLTVRKTKFSIVYKSSFLFLRTTVQSKHNFWQLPKVYYKYPVSQHHIHYKTHFK